MPRLWTHRPRPQVGLENHRTGFPHRPTAPSYLLIDEDRRKIKGKNGATATVQIYAVSDERRQSDCRSAPRRRAIECQTSRSVDRDLDTLADRHLGDDRRTKLRQTGSDVVVAALRLPTEDAWLSLGNRRRFALFCVWARARLRRRRDLAILAARKRATLEFEAAAVEVDESLLDLLLGSVTRAAKHHAWARAGVRAVIDNHSPVHQHVVNTLGILFRLLEGGCILDAIRVKDDDVSQNPRQPATVLQFQALRGGRSHLSNAILQCEDFLLRT